MTINAQKIFIALAFLGTALVHADVIFLQDFSSSTTIGDYANASATTANTTQFGEFYTAASAGPWSITSGAAVLDRTSTGYATNRISRGILDGGVVMTMAFDLKIESSNYTQNGTSFLIGTDNDDADDPLGPYGNRFIMLDFTDVDGDGFTMTQSGGSTSAKVTIGSNDRWSFFVNNLGSAQNYMSPTGSLTTVAANSFDLWIGTTNYFDDEAARSGFDTATGLLTAFNMKMTKNDDAVWTFDNFEITDELSVIPEPSTLFLALTGFGLTFFRRRRG